MNAIRYSQCWEDVDVLRRALRIGSADDVLSIASGGDNTLTLLLDGPHSVAAIDCNPAQLHLLELKARALQHLEYPDFVSFLGARPTCHRRRFFRHLDKRLSCGAREFWFDNMNAIDTGVIHCGKLERYLSNFRRFILSGILSHVVIQQMMALSDTVAQERLYRTEWDTALWRALFRLFFSKTVMGGLGRERSFFRYVDGSSVAATLLDRTRRGLTEIPARTNYLLAYMLTGGYGDLRYGPPYLQEQNHEVLRQNVSALSFHCSGLTPFLQTMPSGTYSRFNLSDVFEYLSPDAKAALSGQLVRTARQFGRAAFWTLFVPQEVPGIVRASVHDRRPGAPGISADDRGFFYGGFHVWSFSGVRHRSLPPPQTAFARHGGRYA